MSRDMGSIIRGAEDTVTLVFPKSVRVVEKDAFHQIQSLKQVIVNDGLEKLESGPDPHGHRGPFAAN